MTITATLLVPAAAPGAGANGAAPGNATERSAESGTPDFTAFLLENVPGVAVKAAKAQVADALKATDPHDPDESTGGEPHEPTQLLAALPLFREMLPSATHLPPHEKDKAEPAEAATASPAGEKPTLRADSAAALPAAALDAPRAPAAVEHALPVLEAPPVLQPVVEARPGAAPPLPVVPLAAPVGQPAWNEEFASKVAWLATSRVQQAELRVQPPDLGPVHVHIRIEANEANVALSAPHADTRNALEAALPDLRELLEARGIALGDTSIGDSRAFGGDPRQAAFQPPAGRVPGNDDTHPGIPAAARTLQLVDVFA
jgi:flagellar hook-length control protein FliK